MLFDRLHTRETLALVLRQQVPYEHYEVVSLLDAGAVGLRVHNLLLQAAVSVLHEWHGVGRHVVEQAAEAPPIARVAEVLRSYCLRRLNARGDRLPVHLVAPLVAAVPAVVGVAEVDQLEDPVLRDHDVLRLQVLVYYSLLVEVFKRQNDESCTQLYLSSTQSPFALHFVYELEKVGTLAVLKAKIYPPLIFKREVHFNDKGVIYMAINSPLVVDYF